ncbi:dsRBD fold-containing protein [Actinotalea subterranea]|uniref:dsRBD fold-containing protein n=1 Tax=Actinotalea subterranea TaxID=2607497 RepID=UPI0011ECA0A0|nr:dsRBD fold-containing protein [Actinotalea subterranea]
MKAAVGDRYVLASSTVDGAVRDGRVVALRHDDGSPPYVVRWSDTGEETLVFPGPDAHVEHGAEGGAGPAGAAATAPPATVATWRIQLTLTHEGPETTAQAVLVAGPEPVGAVGHARKNPHDASEPVIGDEVAVARALRHLADRLIDTAEEQIEDATGRPARVHS